MILSLEWVRGPAPVYVEDSIGHFSDTPDFPLRQTKTNQQQSSPLPAARPRTTAPAQESGLGLPPGLRPLHVSVGRQFTLHPDEIESGTVKHTPAPSKRHSAVSFDVNEHADLFSPSRKAGGGLSSAPAKGKISSPSRVRPRLSSTTFAKKPVDVNEAHSRKPSIITTDSHATSSSSLNRPRTRIKTDLRPAQRRSTQVSSFSQPKRHITFKSDAVGTGGDATLSRQSTVARAVTKEVEAAGVGERKRDGIAHFSPSWQATLPHSVSGALPVPEPDHEKKHVATARIAASKDHGEDDV